MSSSFRTFREWEIGEDRVAKCENKMCILKFSLEGGKVDLDM